jgi:hypothetical protein
MASAQQMARTATQSGAGNEFVPSRHVYVRYLLWALPLPLLVWAAAFFLVCSRSYEQWGQTQWGPVLEFPFEKGTPDADVVVFGDSSAFLGIDPKLINAQLGIRSVVLPGTVGSLPVIGDAALRSYLNHHARPKLIVLYFSPWNLDFNHMAPGRLFEGEEMMIRHGSWSEIVSYELRHPIEFVAFPIRLYSTFGSKLILELLHHKSRAMDTAASLGHAPYVEPFGPLQNLCTIPHEYLEQYGAASVKALRERYAAQGFQVMVYLAPIPKCANSDAVQKRSFAAVGAAPPALLPATDFAADPYYAHIRPPNVPDATQLFITALKPELQQVAPELLGSSAAAVSQTRSAQ